MKKNVETKTANFLQKLKDRGNWNSEYDYSRVKYIDIVTNVIVIKDGFDHEITPHSLLLGSDLTVKSLVDKTKYFIFRAEKKHGQTYDYSMVKYTKSNEKVSIICKTHGEFKQSADAHLDGHNCPQCVGGVRSNADEFIEKAKGVHGEKYDYSLVSYVNSSTCVRIICKEHGEFEQEPGNHLSGTNCPKCTGTPKSNTAEFIEKAKLVHGETYDYSLVDYVTCKLNIKIICNIIGHGIFEQTPQSHLAKHGCLKCSGKQKSNTEEFVDKAKGVHGEKYDYSLVSYTTNLIPVKIICKEHGEFEQSPGNHLAGKNCPSCSQSKGEAEIERCLILNGLIKGIDFIPEKKFNDCISSLGRKLPFDFFCVAHSTCIEFDGMQHFIANDFFGGAEAFERRTNNDRIKDSYCKQQGIKIVRIKYTELDLIESIVTNIVLGVDSKHLMINE